MVWWQQLGRIRLKYFSLPKRLKSFVWGTFPYSLWSPLSWGFFMKPPSSQTSIKTCCFGVVLLYSSINVSKWKTCCGTRTFIIFCQICNCSVTMNVNLKKTKPEYIQFYTYHNYKNSWFKTRIAKHKTILLLGFKRHFDPSWHTLWSGNNWSGTYRSLFWLKFTFANSEYALKLKSYHISEFLSFFLHCLDKLKLWLILVLWKI